MRALALATSLSASLLLGACGAPEAKTEAPAVAAPKVIAPANPHVGAAADSSVVTPANPHATAPANPHAGSPGMGFMPNYEESTDGVRVDEVRPGGAAEKCGLKSGDMITKFGGLPVRDVHDYMAALGTVKVGDKIQIEIKRGDEAMKLDAEVGVSNR